MCPYRLFPGYGINLVRDENESKISRLVKIKPLPSPAGRNIGTMDEDTIVDEFIQSF